MRSYLVIRHVVSTLAVAVLLAAPSLIVDPSGFSVPRLLFWSALGSALYLYFRVRKLGFLPAYDNLNISVLRVLGVSFLAIQMVGLLWTIAG